MRRSKRPFDHSLRRRIPPGTPPGTLVVDPHAHPTVMYLFAFGPDGFEERPIEHPSEVDRFLKRFPVVWLDVTGLGNAELLFAIGKHFHLHELALEDVVNVTQRPKIDRYGDVEFVVLRAVHYREALETEQISLFLGERSLITFQESPGDDWEPIRERIRAGHPLLRSSGADYLAYSLLDAVVDGYFPVLEVLGELLETLEDEILNTPSSAAIARAHIIRRDLLLLRRAIWHQRDVFHGLSREMTPRIREDTRLFLRDCYDHVLQILDLVENYRELVADLQDLYLSSVNYRLNEIMKVLTMMATIFIPLSFITGIYGMNFDGSVSPYNMPELRWRWGYPFALGLMATVGLGFVLFFRRKGWLGLKRSKKEDT